MSTKASLNKLLKPKGLSEKASAQWDRLAGELANSGVVLTSSHRAPLALASTIAADISEDWKELQAEGTYSMGKNGIQIHPAAKRLDALRRDYLKVLAVLMRDVKTEQSAGASLEELLG
jgi:hypothetical protein